MFKYNSKAVHWIPGILIVLYYILYYILYCTVLHYTGYLRPVLHVQQQLLLVHVPQPVVRAAVIAAGVTQCHLEKYF